jgi:hypothetical protein
MFKSKAPKNDTEVALNVAEVVRSEVAQIVEPPAPRAEPTSMRGHALASAPAWLSSVTSNAMVQRRSSVESRANCAHLIS